ncbi:MAG: hypothetical protein DDT21_02284 [Syntrophomonadaceae bacterium]|nr:hypothetical protein [Bacillota bacterium]
MLLATCNLPPQPVRGIAGISGATHTARIGQKEEFTMNFREMERTGEWPWIWLPSHPREFLKILENQPGEVYYYYFCPSCCELGNLFLLPQDLYLPEEDEHISGPYDRLEIINSLQKGENWSPFL